MAIIAQRWATWPDPSGGAVWCVRTRRRGFWGLGGGGGLAEGQPVRLHRQGRRARGRRGLFVLAGVRAPRGTPDKADGLDGALRTATRRGRLP